MTTKDRARKSKKETSTAVSSLISALKFISCAQKNEGTAYQKHCIMYAGFVFATDGIVSAGCKIEEELSACPHTLKLQAALSKCKGELSITQLDNGRLSIKSGAFKAFVPCASMAELVQVVPDNPVATIGESFLKGLEIVSPLASDAGQEIYLTSILCKPGSVTASNGAVLLEYWHGFDFPTLALPKAAASAVAKSGKQLKQFGLGQNSITFYFEDDSFIKSQLYSEDWSDVSEIIDRPSNAWPLPDKFFEAVDAVLPFSELESVYFVEGAVRSHSDEQTGASFEIQGLPSGLIYGGKYLKMLQGIVNKIDFTTYDNCAFFFGENLRGVIMGRAK